MTRLIDNLILLALAVLSGNVVFSGGQETENHEVDRQVINNYFAPVRIYNGFDDVEWSDWGECSVPCGATGTQERTAPCPGDGDTEAACSRVETRECDLGPCKVCDGNEQPLISGNTYNIPSSDLTSSGYWEYPQYHGPAHSRLNDCPEGRFACAWSGEEVATGGWIQADLGQIFVIGSISIKGRSEWGQWVTSFDLGFSLNGTDFNYTPLTGNTDDGTVVSIGLSGTDVARYVRLVVTGYEGHPSLQWEVSGCLAELMEPK